MARESKAQRTARLAQEAAAAAEAYAAATLRAWPERLMRNLERASALDMTIEVTTGSFVVRYYRGNYPQEVKFKLAPEKDSLDDFTNMEELEFVLDKYEKTSQ